MRVVPQPSQQRAVPVRTSAASSASSSSSSSRSPLYRSPMQRFQGSPSRPVNSAVPRRVPSRIEAISPSSWEENFDDFFPEPVEAFSSGPPEIAASEIRVVSQLGEGSYGQVFRGVCRAQDVAVKIVNTEASAEFDEPDSLRTFKEEIAVHQKLYHPNIVLLMGACTADLNQLMIVQELMHTDLEKVLDKQGAKIPLMQRICWAKDVARGMTWLHKSSPPVIHRDLKPSNCLLDKALTHVKIADFGLSAILKNRTMKDSVGARGTLNYIAPEVFEGKEFSQSADVYSFGIVLWQIMTLQQPYDNLDTMSYDGFADLILDDDERPEILDDHREQHPTLTRLITECWRREPNERPDFERIREVLEDGVLEAAIEFDASGRKMWKKYFKGQHAVPRGRLMKGILKYFRLPTNSELHSAELQKQLKYLKILLTEHEREEDSDSDEVSILYFGQVLAWLGPLDAGMLDRIEKLCSQPWFHGKLSAPAAQRLLRGRASGSFLVRFSMNTPGYFTVSTLQQGRVQHQRIHHEPCSTSFTIGNGKVYSSLIHLVRKEKKALKLEISCPGSAFDIVDDDDDEYNPAHNYILRNV